MNNFELHMPTKIYFGKSQIEKLGQATAQYGTRVLVVTGGGSVKHSGIYDHVMRELMEKGLTIFELSGVEPNPRITSVRQGVAICKAEEVEFVLAVGGGSTIDAAKAIAAGARYAGDPWDFYSGQAVIEDALPLGTVLTLAATGSEMNGNSVITNWDAQLKIGIGSPCLFPRFSILDPEYTYTVPRNQTAYGIVDIMAHVFEQYFSPTKETSLQDRIAEGILITVIENAQRVLDNPTDYDARANIMWCGTMALNTLLSKGMETDWASHAIEHELSAIYDIPHGGGLAVVFPSWMRHVLPSGVDKFKQYAIRVWDVDPNRKTAMQIGEEGIEKTEQFFQNLGIPTKLSGYDIDHTNIRDMAKKAVAQGPLGSYKSLGEKDVAAILENAL